MLGGFETNEAPQNDALQKMGEMMPEPDELKKGKDAPEVNQELDPVDLDSLVGKKREELKPIPAEFKDIIEQVKEAIKNNPKNAEGRKVDHGATGRFEIGKDKYVYVNDKNTNPNDRLFKLK